MASPSVFAVASGEVATEGICTDDLSVAVSNKVFFFLIKVGAQIPRWPRASLAVCLVPRIHLNVEGENNSKSCPLTSR